MSGVDKIQDAEARVAEIQDALNILQSGLERAEAVATAAEEAKQRSEQGLRVAGALIVISLVLLVVSIRRHRD